LGIGVLSGLKSSVLASERGPLRLHGLDGLRFVAAFLVAGGHYMGAFLDPVPPLLPTSTGLGMTLFFVLSGFVIHYTYRESIQQRGGVRHFLVARFARLYPLYALVFLVEFAHTVARQRGSCGLAGDQAGLFWALPYYLTLTQAWWFDIKCHNALIYQYGPVSAITWSISVEIAFYLVYLAASRFVDLRVVSSRWVIGIAGASYLVLIAFFLLCGAFQGGIDQIGAATFGAVASSQHGYQDSLLRWLLYFFPAARLPEFLAGIAAAHLYLERQQQVAAPWGNLRVVAVIVAVLAAHLWLYGVVESVLVRRTASPLYAPLVAVMVYALARNTSTVPALVLASPLMVLLGEASYSIYLLHQLLPSAFLRLGLIGVVGAPGWGVWLGALLLLLVVSLASYRYVEWPARTSIRRVWA
jgi:peptidoglycan/LPS O-acetylase OafA/YrhL